MFRVLKIYPHIEPSLPSLGQEAINLGRAALAIGANALAGNQTLVPDDVRNVRETVCKNCEHFRTSDSRCSKCGCCTAGLIFNKIKYAAQKCPLSKWDIWIKTQESLPDDQVLPRG